MDNEIKKEKTRNIISWILFAITIVLILIIGYKVIELKNENKEYRKQIENYKEEIKELKEQLNPQESDKPEVEENENLVVISEDYYVSYSSVWMAPDNYTTLSLKSDNTFSMDINFCEGVASITGTYTKDTNQIILTDIKNIPQGYTGSNTTTITFNVQGDGTLKVNNDVGCMFKDSIFSRK